jgi:hypothetical protein
MAAIPSSANARTPSAWVDTFGSVGALLCAIHCAALPIILAILPIAGLGLLASGGFERGFLVFATGLGLGSLWHGYRKHRALRAFGLLMPGLLAIGAAIWVPILHASPAAHAIGMTSGGMLIALAHWTNLRLTQRSQKSCISCK